MILQALHIPDNSFRCAFYSQLCTLRGSFLASYSSSSISGILIRIDTEINHKKSAPRTSHSKHLPMTMTGHLLRPRCFQFRRQKTYWHSIVSSSPLPFAVRSCQSSAIHDRFSWILTSYTLTDPRNIPCNIQHRNFRIHETDSFWKRRFCFAHVNNHVYPWYAFMSTCHRRVNKTSKLPVFSAKPPSSKM